MFWNNECLCVDTGLEKNKPTISKPDENPEDDDDEVLFLFDSRSRPTVESVNILSSELHEKPEEREILNKCKNSIEPLNFLPFLVNYIIQSIYSRLNTMIYKITKKFVIWCNRWKKTLHWLLNFDRMISKLNMPSSIRLSHWKEKWIHFQLVLSN